ncbi:Hypothetical predicted protein [Mytilus galloprovincialis]|uniref:EB domain-containing protein n=1 Tax=Mytilus galloprovincialis TaxID=29158 RepID=A0A8B6BDX7_MYTGA|nr:Hypothetical predicted protein [Mytilus galloprovincialis]
MRNLQEDQFDYMDLSDTFLADIEGPGVAFGAGCKGTGVGDCTDNNTICDTGSNKCACSATYYRKNATTCATRIAFGASCKGTGIGDCTDTSNICGGTSKKCECSTTSYKENATTCATKMALNVAFTATQTGQCTDSNAECHATKHTCGCKSTHFVNKAGACHQRKSPKVNCASGECVSHASCDSGTNKCVCDAGYDPSPIISPTMCNGVVKVLTLSYMYVVPILVSLNFLLR